MVHGASKSRCREICEQIFRKYAERIDSGFKTEARIPNVGRLWVSVGICALIFDKDLITSTYGTTAIDYKQRHHSAQPRNNLMTSKELDKGKTRQEFL